MACRFSELVIDCRDPEALAAFWAAVLDYRVLSREDGAVEIGPAASVNATDRDQAAELQRLLELGATPADVGQTGDEGWHVLADPEGNEFCLLRQRLDPL
jgi:hypothetical protein